MRRSVIAVRRLECERCIPPPERRARLKHESDADRRPAFLLLKTRARRRAERYRHR